MSHTFLCNQQARNVSHRLEPVHGQILFSFWQWTSDFLMRLTEFERTSTNSFIVFTVLLDTYLCHFSYADHQSSFALEFINMVKICSISYMFSMVFLSCPLEFSYNSSQGIRDHDFEGYFSDFTGLNSEIITERKLIERIEVRTYHIADDLIHQLHVFVHPLPLMKIWRSRAEIQSCLRSFLWFFPWWKRSSYDLCNSCRLWLYDTMSSTDLSSYVIISSSSSSFSFFRSWRVVLIVISRKAFVTHSVSIIS